MTLNVKLNFKIQAGLILMLLVSLVFYSLGKQIPDETVENIVKTAGSTGPIVFIFLALLSYVLAPISGVPFLIAGFYLFGGKTVIYIYISAVLGSAINFLIAKKWGRPIVTKLVGKESILKIDKLVKKYGMASLITLRIFFGGMGDFVSYAYGLTPMSFKRFMTISVLAMIPGSILWYFLVSRIDTIEQFLLINYFLLTVFVVVFFAGSYIFRKIKGQ